jgi:hypothetical protein
MVEMTLMAKEQLASENSCSRPLLLMMAMCFGSALALVLASWK